MNQQEKELVLKDLCSRLPYGVKISNHVNKVVELTISDFPYYREKGCLPILHPISALTQEITVNGDTFVPTERLTEAVNDYYIQEYDKRWKDRFVFRTSNNAFYFERGAYDDYEHVSLIQNSNSQECPKFLLDMLNEWHFNHQLPDHLFVPVTETFNPYKS